jgi:hypothetical protein
VSLNETGNYPVLQVEDKFSEEKIQSIAICIGPPGHPEQKILILPHESIAYCFDESFKEPVQNFGVDNDGYQKVVNCNAEEMSQFLRRIKNCHLENWRESYNAEPIYGLRWSVDVHYTTLRRINVFGEGYGPPEFDMLMNAASALTGMSLPNSSEFQNAP